MINTIRLATNTCSAIARLCWRLDSRSTSCCPVPGPIMRAASGLMRPSVSKVTFPAKRVVRPVGLVNRRQDQLFSLACRDWQSTCRLWDEWTDDHFLAGHRAQLPVPWRRGQCLKRQVCSARSCLSRSPEFVSTFCARRYQSPYLPATQLRRQRKPEWYAAPTIGPRRHCRYWIVLS
jgi:hypothetical protein